MPYDDYDRSKHLYADREGNPGQNYPINSTLSSAFELEPIITPDQLIYRYLFGIPLVSFFPDPITGKRQVMTHDILKDFITRATQEAEVQTQIDINPKKYNERLPYLRQDFEAFGHFLLPHKPVHSIDRFSVSLSDGQDVFEFPRQWIDVGQLAANGQINLIPLAFQATLTGTVIGSTNPQNAVFFNSLWNRNWVQSLFSIEFTTGFVNREVPLFINDLIGTIAAINILSALAATWARVTSTSLGLDGVSQSITGPGPLIFVNRIQELMLKRQMLVDETRALFGQSMICGTI